MTADAERDERRARLLARCGESARRRAEQVAARRERAACRAHGLASRHAWRLMRLDGRAAAERVAGPAVEDRPHRGRGGA